MGNRPRRQRTASRVQPREPQREPAYLQYKNGIARLAGSAGQGVGTSRSSHRPQRLEKHEDQKKRPAVGGKVLSAPIVGERQPKARCSRQGYVDEPDRGIGRTNPFRRDESDSSWAIHIPTAIASPRS
jgi:hypothetical protein